MTGMHMTEQAREERYAFLVRRQGGIGGSDVPAILGLSDWRDALDVYHDKTRPIRKEDIESDTIHQMRGHTFEGMALAHYWLKTGRRGRAVKTPSYHPDYPNVVVSLDFDIFADEKREEGKRGPGVGELKSPVSSIFRRVYENGLRESEIVQLQTNIAVTRRTWGSFGYFNMEDNHGPILAVDQLADPDLGPYVLERAQKFWNEHVEPRIPPTPADWLHYGGETAPAIADMSGELEVIEDDPELAAMVEVLLTSKELAKEAKDVHEAHKARVFEELKDRGLGKSQIPGLARLTVVTKQGRETLNTDQLRDSLPLDRDKVAKHLMRFMKEEAAAFAEGGGLHMTEESIGLMLFETMLDFDRFVKVGNPSQYLLANRMKEEAGS